MSSREADRKPRVKPGGTVATRRGIGASAGRIGTLAGTTFLQLLRMKTFYFLLIFSILVVVASTFNVLHHTGEQHLKLLKDVALGAMSLFTSLFAIVATALLIPSDLEDRTLQTILAKPVPRYDYILGKLCGVILVVAVSVVVMDLIFGAVLYAREEMMVAAELAGATESGGFAEEDLAVLEERLRSQGLNWNLQNAVAAIFLKSCVICAVTMLVSTIASTSLFTIIVGFVIFFIGHLQSVARDYWMHALDAGLWKRLFSGLVALIFPDFQIFNVVDGVVAGEVIPLGAMTRMAGLTILYVMVYSMVAYLVFADREL